MSQQNHQISEAELAQFWGTDTQQLKPKLKQTLWAIIQKLKKAQQA